MEYHLSLRAGEGAQARWLFPGSSFYYIFTFFSFSANNTFLWYFLNSSGASVCIIQASVAILLPASGFGRRITPETHIRKLFKVIHLLNYSVGEYK